MRKIVVVGVLAGNAFGALLAGFFAELWGTWWTARSVPQLENFDEFFATPVSALTSPVPTISPDQDKSYSVDVRHPMPSQERRAGDDVHGEDGGSMWVAKYARWHAESLRNAKSVHALRYVFLCTRGGTGNQVLGLISAFLFAVLTERVLLIHCHTSLGAFKEPFQWNGTEVVTPQRVLDAGDALHVNLISKVIKNKPDSWNFFRCSNFTGIKHRSVVITTDQFFAPVILQNPNFEDVFLRAFSRADVVTTVFRDLFRPHPDVIQAAHRFKRDHFPRGTVGLQWRLDGATGADTEQNALTKEILQDIKDCIDRASGKDSGNTNSSVIYLASIDGWVGRQLTHAYPGVRILRFHDHAKDYGFGMIAQDAKYRQKIGNSVWDKYAMIDTLLLGLADDFVATQFSSFGYVASMFSQRPALELRDRKYGCGFPGGGKTYRLSRMSCQLSSAHVPCFQGTCFAYPDPQDSCPRSGPKAGLASKALWAPFFRSCAG